LHAFPQLTKFYGESVARVASPLWGRVREGEVPEKEN